MVYINIVSQLISAVSDLSTVLIANLYKYELIGVQILNDIH